MTHHPLAQLRDIHMPAAPSAFPPSYMALFIGGILFLFFVIILTRYTLKLLRAREQHAILSTLLPEGQSFSCEQAHIFLKRYAKKRYPKRHPERLSGEAWQQFLMQTGKLKPKEHALLHAFMQGQYNPNSAIDTTMIKQFVLLWLRRQR